MSDFLDLIKAEIKKDADKERFYSQHGTCKDVDKTERTCTFVPAGDDAERYNIRFQSLMGSIRGWVVIPVEGSAITVTFVNKSTGFVSLTEDIEEIIYQGGSNGGLINIEPLITKMNNLENAHNALLAKYNAHTHITTATTVTLPAPIIGVISPTVATSTDTVIPTIRKDIEDKLFLH